MSNSKYYVFTINNPEVSGQKLADTLEQHCSYYVFQKEKAPTTGTEHFQGYLEFPQKKRLEWLKKHVGQGHFETRKGSRAAAAAYCSKEASRIEGPWTGGVPPPPQGETKLARTRMVELAKAGRSVDSIIREEPEAALLYARGLERVHRALNPPRPRTVDVHLLVGPPGTGKTTYLLNKFGGEAHWQFAGSDKWWDGYDGQRVLIIDEYRGWIALAELLNILDVVPLRKQTKGGFVALACSEIWITTNVHPHNWYEWSGREDDWPALKRRFHHVYHMHNFELEEENKELYLNAW